MPKAIEPSHTSGRSDRMRVPAHQRSSWRVLTRISAAASTGTAAMTPGNPVATGSSAPVSRSVIRPAHEAMPDAVPRRWICDPSSAMKPPIANSHMRVHGTKYASGCTVCVCQTESPSESRKTASRTHIRVCLGCAPLRFTISSATSPTSSQSR